MKAIGGNSGYVGYSESKRSRRAKNDGRFPKTEFKKVHSISEKKFKELVDRGVISVSEWHHTSKFGNRTEFYSIDNPIMFALLTGDKDAAMELYRDERDYSAPIHRNRRNTIIRFQPEIIVNKLDTDTIGYLDRLGARYTLTGRNNRNYQLPKNLLNNIELRELFEKY